MKYNTISKLLLALALSATLGTSAATAKDKGEAKLAGKARISKAKAQVSALTRVPDGKVIDAELEEEHGKLIWSFDLMRPGTKNVTEVAVDAITGAIVNVEIETPKDRAKEAKEDAAMKGKKK